MKRLSIVRNLEQPWMIRQLSGVMFALLSVAAVGFANDPEPPRPNPIEPVDYGDWINKTFGGSIKDNAQADYQAAFAGLKPLDGDWDPALGGPWSGHPEIAQWLKTHQGNLKKFRLAAAKKECFFPIVLPKTAGKGRADSLLMNVELAHLSGFRQCSQALLAEGFQAWQGGDQKVLPANALSVVRGSRHLQSNPFLIERLSSYGVAAQAYASLRTALQLSNDRFALAETLMRELPEADLPRVPFSRALFVERIGLWDSAQRLFVRGKGGTGWEVSDEVFQQDMLGFQPNDRQKIARIGFDETMRTIDAYQKARDEWCQAPYHKSAERLPDLRRIVQECNNPFTNLFPSLERARELDARIAASQRATYLIVNLFAHHGKDGTFPESLAKLSLSGQDDWKIDPFSGKEFVYHKKGDDFVLYSIAENLKDDGGKHHEKGSEADFVFWPVHAGY